MSQGHTNAGKLFLHAVISTVLLLGLIGILSETCSLLFAIQTIVIVVGVVLVFAGLVTRNRILFFTFYVLSLLDIIIVGVYQNFYILLAVVGLLGFFLSLPQPREEEELVEELIEEPHSIVFDEPEPIEVKPVTKAKHTPGKYVASKNSNIYHEPKCEWGKRIATHRRLWFSKKEDAWEKGYKAHNCVN